MWIQRILRQLGNSYFPSTTIQALSSFAWIAVLSRTLATNDFAVWVLLEPLIFALSHLFLWGGNHAIIKNLSKNGINAFDVIRATLTQSIKPFGILLALTSTVVFVFLDTTISIPFIIVIILESLFLAALSISRGLSSPALYLRLILTRYISLATIVFAFFELLNVIEISTCLFLLAVANFLALVEFLRKFHIHYKTLPSCVLVNPENLSPDSLKEYGTPLMANTLVNFALLFIDRYLVAAFLGLEAAANYAILHKCATAINFAVTPLNLWWPSARFKHLD
jgi:O-antigen/teichoic acid export membrane protein